MGAVRKENRAAAAFRRYARLGLDAPMSSDARRERLRGCAASDTDLRELSAVAETLHLLSAFGEERTLRAVRVLWMEQARTVSSYALEDGCSERSLFRRLGAVRDCFERLVASEEDWL